ncbi:MULTISPECIES: hypothetical protein [Erwinia]|uniref:Uncharacterized protein n=2 Tax=Erwinia TaxID=551 RepID=A0ABY5X8J6_ERWPY|nr:MULTISPECIES: hypothetical protein [Erwinia]AUX74309.1 hypothetical protein CPI84_18770 [Erwinia pyrifoliae]MCA8875334.1 hypothetical protein [Erwinia pyrifoliae]UWS33716.1 hypothetical protein NYP84_00315 [Erwinia pyrifoliae]CAX53825.1 Putative phage-related protein [Erwinia pyrifoliae Ep1/96]
MSNLFKLKKWLAVEDTAKRLSKSMGESVSPSDCLQLALDGHLTISVLLDGDRYGVLAKEVITTKREFLKAGIIQTTPDGAYINVLGSENFFSNSELDADFYRVEREGSIRRLKSGDLYDLPMIGAELLDVLHEFESERGKVPREFHNIEGAFLSTSIGTFNIMESFNEFVFNANNDGEIVYFDKEKGIPVDFDNYHDFFYPADSLGKVEFVFRTKNIEKFENGLLNDSDNNLSLNESLQIIGTLLDTLKNADIKSKRWTQDSLKSEMVERNSSLKQRKIDDYFSEANKILKSNK